jgi:ADP-heptose:LPS heptosyltransferase
MPGRISYDCRFYLGDRPCGLAPECEGCAEYAPQGTRIVVVKLAAAGDVLRATSILPPLKRKHPESHVTWVADEAALPLIASNPSIDRAMPFGFETWLRLSVESFDVAIGLDKEPRAGALMRSIRARESLGFALSKWGTIEPLNDGALYDLALGLSDEMKFNVNTKTYPEIFCAIAELTYRGEPYELVLPDSAIEYARRFLSDLSPREPLVGLNVGSGSVFANKAWTPRGFADLARIVAERLGGTALVLGGAEDRTRAEEVLSLAGGAARDGGVHDLLDFCGIVASLDALVTGDTMALHVAIAMGVPVVAIFGPTVPSEIAIYGAGRKVVSTAGCAPCYRRSCDESPSCMDGIGAEEVAAALAEVLEER